VKSAKVQLSEREIELLIRGLENSIDHYRALAKASEQQIKEHGELAIDSRLLLDKLKTLKVKEPPAPKAEPIPDYGDHMTMAEFKESCEGGMFTDDDGDGNYATVDRMFKKAVNSDDVIDGKTDPKYTHVVWFNK